MLCKKIWLKDALSVVFLLLLIPFLLLMLQAYAQGHFQSVESLRQYIGQFGLLAPLILTVVQALQVIVPVLPGFLGSIVGAGLFGVWGGFWCNYIGISAGSIIAFLLAKRYGTALVRQLISLDHYTAWIDRLNRKKSYTLILFLAILLPLAPDDFLCYFSGLMGMSTRKFVWIILLAKPWCILGYSIFFASIAQGGI